MCKASPQQQGESDQKNDRAVYVSSVDGAAEYLKGTRGKHSGDNRKQGNRQIYSHSRLQRAGVCPGTLPGNLAAQCAEHGFEGKNLICMQGPFSKR